MCQEIFYSASGDSSLQAHEVKICKGSHTGKQAYPAAEAGKEACCWLCTSSTARRMLAAVWRRLCVAAMASLCSCVLGTPASAADSLAAASCAKTDVCEGWRYGCMREDA